MKEMFKLLCHPVLVIIFSPLNICQCVHEILQTFKWSWSPWVTSNCPLLWSIMFLALIVSFLQVVLHLTCLFIYIFIFGTCTFNTFILQFQKWYKAQNGSSTHVLWYLWHLWSPRNWRLSTASYGLTPTPSTQSTCREEKDRRETLLWNLWRWKWNQFL